MINKNYHGQGLGAFWPDDLDVYMLQFPPQGVTWHHRLMLKVTSCGRKCAANKPKPGSAHDRRHIMTSPRHTGISRRDIQTSAPYASVKQIKICAEYRGMVPKTLAGLSGTPELRPIGLRSGSWQTRFGLGYPTFCTDLNLYNNVVDTISMIRPKIMHHDSSSTIGRQTKLNDMVTI